MRDVVETPEQAAAEPLPPLLVLRAGRGGARRGGARRGAARGRADRRRALERHLPDPPRRRALRAPAPAAPAAAALGPRRPARGAPAERARGDATCACPRVLLAHEDESALGVPFYVMDVVDGVVFHDELPPALDTPGGARADRRGARRRAGRAPRGAAARGPRRPDRLPRAPAAPLRRPLGADAHARAAGRRGGAPPARGDQARVAARDDRPRRLPARQHDVRGRGARPPARDPRLGARHGRRPARRRRLPDRDLDRARLALAARRLARSPRARASRRGPSSSPATRR